MPIRRARSRWWSGSLLDKIEIKIRLSMPRTTSSAISVSRAAQAAGSAASVSSVSSIRAVPSRTFELGMTQGSRAADLDVGRASFLCCTRNDRLEALRTSSSGWQ